MLKFKVIDEKVELVENDRGEWVKGAYSEEFGGFGTENVLTIVLMSMQSGIWDVVVVHSRVDDFSRVGRSSGKDVDEAINEAVRQVYE